MMNKNKWFGKSSADLRFLSDCAGSMLIDTAFLVFWFLGQRFVGRIVYEPDLAILDQLTLVAFQVLFTLSTLGPIVIYVLSDVGIMGLQAWYRVREEAATHDTIEEPKTDRRTEEQETAPHDTKKQPKTEGQAGEDDSNIS